MAVYNPNDFSGTGGLYRMKESDDEAYGSTSRYESAMNLFLDESLNTGKDYSPAFTANVYEVPEFPAFAPPYHPGTSDSDIFSATFDPFADFGPLKAPLEQQIPLVQPTFSEPSSCDSGYRSCSHTQDSGSFDGSRTPPKFTPRKFTRKRDLGSHDRRSGLGRHAAVGCPARSRPENLAKTETRLGRVSGERTPDGNRKRLPAVSLGGVSLTKPGDTDYHQPYPDPALTMTHVTIRQETPANTTCSPFHGEPHSLPLASPENCSPQQPHNETPDQFRLQPTRRMASADILQTSPATSIDCPSPETTSSNWTSVCTDSDESSSFLETNDAHLVVLHSKHMLLADLMQEVYAIFDQRWDAKIQAHAGSSPTNTPPSSQDRTRASFRKGKKRCRDDRDFTPPDEGQRRKGLSSEFSSNTDKQNDPFACPFYKHEPGKYCCSIVDGSKYRACVGPGFASIARLKQHLKRVHSAPIQCTRCWLVMSDLHAMSVHANQETRCEAQDPRPEGISVDKMNLITSKWGATWADIYSIIFPGAPIPSPYYEYGSPETTRERSPQSRSFADFEAYSRTELPRLVEANLQVIVSSEMAPLEESLRAMLVDIVRRCQSTVAQNYGRINSPPAGEIARTEHSSFDPTETLFPAFQSTGPQGSEPLLLPNIPNISTEDPTLSSQETSTTFGRNDLHPEGMRDFFEEPPLGNTDPVDSSLDMGSYALENPPSDSGYGSFLFFCECPNGLDYRVENDKGICSSCGLEGDYCGNEDTKMPNFGS